MHGLTLSLSAIVIVPLLDISFSHYGLANTTLVLTVVTFLTGVILLAGRYGYVLRENWRTVVRMIHVVVGVFMTLYLIGTYLLTPV